MLERGKWKREKQKQMPWQKRVLQLPKKDKTHGQGKATKKGRGHMSYTSYALISDPDPDPDPNSNPVPDQDSPWQYPSLAESMASVFGSLLPYFGGTQWV